MYRIKQLELCVYSNSRNDVPRVAQRYGTIAAHTRRRASVLAVFIYLSTSTKRIASVRENTFKAGIVRANEYETQRQGRWHNSDIVSIFLSIKVCCVFSLESPREGDSNEKTQYTICNINKKKNPKLSQICIYGMFSKGLKNEFETVMVNESSVFEPLKLYCFWSRTHTRVRENLSCIKDGASRRSCKHKPSIWKF